MIWPTWKEDLFIIAISMIIVAPLALYGPLWLRPTGSGGPVSQCRGLPDDAWQADD